MVTLLVILLGLGVLVKSAEVLVEQASALAKKLKVNDFLIGFTVVAFGTSLPELTSAIFSSIDGQNDLVVSGIIGSNITNLCLIFGIVALFNSYRLRKRDVDINIPLNFAALTAFWALAVFMNFRLNWWAGGLLLGVFGLLIWLSKEYNHLEIGPGEYVKFNWVYLVMAVVLLVVSGKVVVDQIINLSGQMKVSETILGYFLLAVGTSLPELVTTWSAVRKKSEELGIGSILGSNLFNLLFVLGTASLIRPVDLGGFIYDLIFLTGATLVVYIFAVWGKKYAFSRKEGLGLVGLYFLFIIFQISRVIYAK